jgi:hypothetical protein
MGNGSVSGERERDIYKHMANSSKFPVCIVSRFLSCGYFLPINQLSHPL